MLTGELLEYGYSDVEGVTPMLTKIIIRVTCTQNVLGIKISVHLAEIVIGSSQKLADQGQ